MAVWKRYNGKRIKGEGPKGKGTWIVEFRLRGHYVKQAIPEARSYLPPTVRRFADFCAHIARINPILTQRAAVIRQTSH